MDCTPGYNNWTEFIAEARGRKSAMRGEWDADWWLGRDVAGSVVTAVEGYTLELRDGRTLDRRHAWKEVR